MATPHITKDALNAHRSGFDAAMEFEFVRASRDEVAAQFTVTAQHVQPYGIVHGGVHCGIVETLCSTGAAVDAMSRGQSVVGLENHTTFLRAVRVGARLTATATPLTRGRRTQVWEARIVDQDGRLVATGRVRLLCLEPGSDLGGQKVGRPEAG
jgi:1,4-dihydroxy-2-naphthoyl-CoA hydrolase